MRYMQTPAILVAFLVLGLAVPLYSQNPVQISEFLAVNDQGLDDEDRDEEDWIEIHNSGMSAVSLEGWYLTDKADDLTKWKFPAVTLGPDAYLIVFASGKNRRDPATKLHTNFKLSGSGEYLALVLPDGVTAASQFSPAYPIQAPDISYGLGGATSETVLLAPGAPAKALVPVNGALEPIPQPNTLRPWTLEDLEESAWQSGTTGVGYGYPGLVGLNVSAMRNVNETVYTRVPFVVEDPSVIRSLTLRVSCDDGMIAYINGHEVARENAPDLATETWNSGAIASWPDRRAAVPIDYVIRQSDFLHVGTNMLAIQGLNYQVSSPDLLVIPELFATVGAKVQPLRYFPTPTPGQPNSAGVEVLGPIIADADHRPRTPTGRDALQITARITPSFAPVAQALLHYRVMFNQVATVPLLDDGKNGDVDAGDGLFLARIPSGAAGPGQMVRWYITAADTAGRESRFPAFLDPSNSPEYCGAVVLDPSLNSPLPVLHWFIENPTAANTDAGTRCAFFYDGEFYDNVSIYLHGQSSRGFPKKSYNVDFHPGHNFKWDPNQPRADDINLMTTYPDKAQMRNILAYETYRDADCAYHWVFPVRVQQNAAFWGTAHVMENGDRDWLVRMGVNPDGALYKMYNAFTDASHTTSGAEKKTRKNEDNADLLAMFVGISRTGEDRRQYVYDNVDVPQVVNFLAARVLTGDVDCCHKNYYFYRDTGRTNEWQMWPWDVDLSFGRRWTSSMTYWDQTLIANTSLFIGNNNRMPQAMFDTPEIRQMYVRRIRTLMDELLKPGPLPAPPASTPGPPVRPVRGVVDGVPMQAAAEPNATTQNQYYEHRIDELAALLAPDAALDAAKWNSHAWGNGSTAPNYPQFLPEAVAEMRNSYLPERRRQLFSRLTSGATEIPNAQPAGTVVTFGMIEASPASGNPEEQFVLLLNPNSIAVDISGWTLSAGANTQVPIFKLRGGTVIPAGGTLYVAANRTAFRTRRSFPTGGQALFVVGDFTRRLASRGETFELTDRQGVKVASTSTR